MIATALLGTALVAVAQLFATSTRANTNARASTFAMVLAQQKMEQLRGLAWGFDAQGNRVSDFQSDLAVTPPAASGGPGLAPSPVGTLLSSTAGYVDYLSPAGAYVGTGTTPPGNSVYLRRWSVTPLPEDPANTLVLQVMVTRQRNRGAVANAGAGLRLPNEARIVSLKTRKSR
jgi:type II secretory pathway pseudopilin PulG